MSSKYCAEYRAYLVLKALLQMVPLGIPPSRTERIGGWVFYLFKVRQRVAMANLRYAFGGRYDEKELTLLLRRMYGHLFRTTLELVHIRRIASRMDDFVRIRHLDRFREALRQGRGAILVTGHFGNFELGALALAWAGLPMTPVIKPLRNPLIDREINQLRGRLGAEIITLKERGNETGREILHALRRNRIVCLLSDQDVGQMRGTMVRFFGHPTSTPTGAARMALQTRAPLLPTFICRDASGRHLLEIEPPLAMDYARDAREREVHRITQEISNCLERWVSRCPEQYFWLHRRWKSTPEGKVLYQKKA